MLKTKGISPDLIPVPREIASDCGFCLLLEGFEGRMNGMLDIGLEYEAIWKRWVDTDREGRKRNYERIATDS